MFRAILASVQQITNARSFEEALTFDCVVGYEAQNVKTSKKLAQLPGLHDYLSSLSSDKLGKRADCTDVIVYREIKPIKVCRKREVKAHKKKPQQPSLFRLLGEIKFDAGPQRNHECVRENPKLISIDDRIQSALDFANEIQNDS